MATQDILVNYKSNVDQLTQQLEKVAVANEKLSDSVEKTSTNVKKNVITEEQAAKKRLALMKAEEAELKRLQQARKLAFDPKIIADYDRKIAASQQKISLLGRQSASALAGVGAQIGAIGRSIALGIGAAFSVDAIINFSKASVNAFIEAQENAEKLRFTITQVGGESEVAFERLISQSEKLQSITIFSDDAIQQAQNALATFGLTSDQIEELLPKLADFASATKTDIVAAAQQVGAGLEGAGREFKKYGIEVSATASRLENLSEITEGFAKFQGSAAKETETLSGQLKQQANAVDDLQESIGSRLAQSFVEVRFATLKFIETLIKLFDTAEQKRGERLTTQRELLRQSIEANIAGDAEIDNLTIQEEAQKKLVETGKRLIEIKKEIKANPLLFPQLDNERQRLVQTAGILTEIIDLEKNRLANEAKISSQDVKAASDARIAGSAAEVKAIQTLSAEYSALFELLNDEQKARLIELSVTANIDSEAEIREKIAQIEQLFEANQIEIPVTTDPLNSITALRERFDQLKTTLESQGITVPINPDQQSLENFRTEVAKLQIELSKGITVPVKLEVPEGRADVEGVFPGQLTEDEIKQQQELNDQLLAQTEDLLGSTLELYNVYTNNRLQQIDKERDAKLEAIDAEQAAVNDLIENRRISETEAERLNKQLTEKRLATQAQADKKERALKRKAFDIDKAAALVKIAINTAVAVTENLGVPILAAFIAAAGAAEAAVVASQANPYEKGTKKSKKGLALVDEKGAELIQSGGRLTYLEQDSKVLPAKQTKTYGEVIDAMFDNRFEKYVMDKYVTPRLLAQKNKQESEKSKSFAQNMARSITYNQIPQQTGNKLSNVNVTNYRELGDHIAHRLKKDIYRS